MDDKSTNPSDTEEKDPVDAPTPNPTPSDEKPAPKQKPSWKKIVCIAAAAAACVSGGTYWYVTYQVPHNEAVDEFNAASQGLEKRNAKLDRAIKGLQTVLKSDDKPLDDAVAEAASAKIGEAQAARQKAPELPSSTEEILASARNIEDMGNYAEQLNDLTSARNNLENSIAQLKQVTNPSEAFVVQRLKGLKNIAGVEAVTEDNDPNGQLNKKGGYTTTVYLSSNLVDRSKLYLDGSYTPIVDAGCDGGGAVEVYATVDDANKRNDYLASFDGGILASGSHTVVGTCVVRTSTHLTASQQREMEKEIIDSLTKLK